MLLAYFRSNPEGIERELPEVLPPAKTSDENEEVSIDVKEKQKPDEAPRTILGGSISSDGHLMALCDDRKQLTLWKCEDWSLVNQWTIQRRANKVIFNNDSTAIFLAGMLSPNDLHQWFPNRFRISENCRFFFNYNVVDPKL